jgi:hypothetical protein
MTIAIYKKNNYGIVSWYVLDTTQAEAISALTGKKTISNSNMKALEVLGFTFTEVIAP